MAAVIESKLKLADAEQRLLRGLSDVALTNWNGVEVGRIRAAALLRKTS